MPLQPHVVSLDLALALQDAGYPQENALFYWSIPKPENASNEEERLVLANNCEVELCHKWTDWGEKFDRVAAPLASELGEVLPKEIHGCELTLMKHAKWHYGYCCIDSSERDLQRWECKVSADTEADARARLFLHLRKSSLI